VTPWSRPCPLALLSMGESSAISAIATVSAPTHAQIRV
jgi:hypothetical protein